MARGLPETLLGFYFLLKAPSYANFKIILFTDNQIFGINITHKSI